MFRVVHRRSAPIIAATWRTQPSTTAGLLVRISRVDLMSNPRLISSAILGDRKNVTFTPKDAVPDIDQGPPVAQSDTSTITEIDLTQFLPSDPSAAASVAAELIEKIGPLTATDVGLTWWCPTGGMFKIFEFLHEYLPWWGTIAVATLVARILMFPLVIYSQKNTARMSQHMPEMQDAQSRFQKARRIGNQADILKASMELQEAMVKSNQSMMATLIPAFAQAPVFMSFFFSLRAMTNHPVPSMTSEGLFWFQNLTIPDPYFILPIITSSTLFVVLKMGIEYGNGASTGVGPQIAGIDVKKIFQYSIPVMVLMFSRSFSSGILVYWCTTNFISLAQVAILNQPTIRTWLQIPELKKPNPADMPSKPKRSLTESWEEFRLSNQVEDRSRILTEQAFARAATGPLRKTYKTDPTKKLV